MQRFEVAYNEMVLKLTRQVAKSQISEDSICNLSTWVIFGLSSFFIIVLNKLDCNVSIGPYYLSIPNPTFA